MSRVANLPLYCAKVGITLDQEDAVTNLCRAFQEWDGYRLPIEAYRAQVEREIVREGIAALSKRWPT